MANSECYLFSGTSAVCQMSNVNLYSPLLLKTSNVLCMVMDITDIGIMSEVLFIYLLQLA